MREKYQNTWKNRLRYSAFFMCGLASLFYVYDFLLRVMPSAMTEDLMRHFSLDASGLGLMLAAFYYAVTIHNNQGGSNGFIPSYFSEIILV
ncbi:MAG: hypothetical protein ABIH48_01905 [Candidatus Falkowbacteria bacterium]